MDAGKFAPKNLVLLVDYNKVQLDGQSKDIMPLDPLGDKFRAFNWNVAEKSYDGHCVEEIEKSFAWLGKQNKGPSVIIYDTTKGKGVDFTENTHSWHGAPVSADHLKDALPQLKEVLSKWEDE